MSNFCNEIDHAYIMIKSFTERSDAYVECSDMDVDGGYAGVDRSDVDGGCAGVERSDVKIDILIFYEYLCCTCGRIWTEEIDKVECRKRNIHIFT